jgi:O-succinylbenzoate synthase
LKAFWIRHRMEFITPGGTSRGVMTFRDTWFITIARDMEKGIGECGMLKGLSIDDRHDFEKQLSWTCNNIHLGLKGLYDANVEFPAIQFGVEMAFADLDHGGKKIAFPSKFTEGKESIPINGLIWMGTISEMRTRIAEKLDAGFRCLKLKIGALDWEAEHELLTQLRRTFGPEDLEIRVDANGGFAPDFAPTLLLQLAALDVHSIEQPIAPGQWEEMASLCEQTPVPIALDEELIPLTDYVLRERMLSWIRPQYLILKPSFIGGWQGSAKWIALAQKYGCGWWATSALESSIGLNAIAQWTAVQGNLLPQGLGTGALFTNNISSPLQVKQAALWYEKDTSWGVVPNLD